MKPKQDKPSTLDFLFCSDVHQVLLKWVFWIEGFFVIFIFFTSPFERKVRNYIEFSDRVPNTQSNHNGAIVQNIEEFLRIWRFLQKWLWVSLKINRESVYFLRKKHDQYKHLNALANSDDHLVKLEVWEFLDVLSLIFLLLKLLLLQLLL